MMTVPRDDELTVALARLDALDARDWTVTTPTMLALLNVVTAVRRLAQIANASIEDKPEADRRVARIDASRRLALLTNVTVDALARQIAADEKADRAARRAVAKRSTAR